MKRLQTWCHRCPVDAPTRSSTTTIRVEVDVHGIGLCRDDWWQGVATGFVHQGCTVSIRDFDMVAWAFVNISADSNSEFGELQPQYLPTLYSYRLRLVEVERVVAGIVWRSENTCGR